MDWVISLDVGGQIPAESQSIFLDNLCRLAGQGVLAGKA